MTEAGYFDRLYADQDDPWQLSTSDYERRKLGLLMSSLPRARYRNAFEPGCAIGVTSQALAARCDRLTAMDSAVAAVRQAHARLLPYGNVVVVQGRVPEDWPDQTFDLVVLSELLYYLDAEARSGVAERLVTTLEPNGDLVVVHWRHPFVEAASTGDDVHADLADRLGAAGLGVRSCHVEEDFRLEVFGRSGSHQHQRNSTPCASGSSVE